MENNLLNVIKHNLHKLRKFSFVFLCIFIDILICHALTFFFSCHTCVQAMRSTQGSIKPIFISIGHKISLQTAIMIVQMTCKYRVPEPIRQVKLSAI